MESGNWYEFLATSAGNAHNLSAVSFAITTIAVLICQRLTNFVIHPEDDLLCVNMGRPPWIDSVHK
jgi:hypothetical protein